MYLAGPTSELRAPAQFRAENDFFFRSLEQDASRGGLGSFGDLGICPCLIALITTGITAGIPFVLGLFKKGKPTLTAAQLDTLRRLPEPYLSRAVAELESSPNMNTAFASVFEKYAVMWDADRKAAAAAKQKKVVSFVIIGAFVVTAGIVGYTLTRR